MLNILEPFSCSMTNRVIDGQIPGQQLRECYFDPSFLKAVFVRSDTWRGNRQLPLLHSLSTTIGAHRLILWPDLWPDSWPKIPHDQPGWLIQLYSFNHQNLRLVPMLTTSLWTRQWRVSVTGSRLACFWSLCLFLASFFWIIFLSCIIFPSCIFFLFWPRFFLHYDCLQVSATCSRTIWRRATLASPPLLTTFLSCLISLTTWLICLV